MGRENNRIVFPGTVSGGPSLARTGSSSQPKLGIETKGPKGKTSAEWLSANISRKGEQAVFAVHFVPRRKANADSTRQGEGKLANENGDLSSPNPDGYPELGPLLVQGAPKELRRLKISGIAANIIAG